MILQNKQTGVLGVLEATTYHGGRPDNIVEVYEMGMGAVRVLAQYNTLEGLLEEWEDYQPAEPLIKDEKIRKAVRAWAEANDFESVFYDYDDFYGVARFILGETVMIIETDEILKEHRGYTIEELCGEVEE